jgi:hypothetical protein
VEEEELETGATKESCGGDELDALPLLAGITTAAGCAWGYR